MPKTIFVSFPVNDVQRSAAFYKALGFQENPQFSGDSGVCLMWGEAIHVMPMTHAQWRKLTDRPLPAPGAVGMMLSLALDSREAVDAMNEAAAAHGGKADANPAEDHGFMYSRDIADPDGHLWGPFWMNPAATGEPQ